MITVIGIFDDTNLAEDASTYLLANEFKSEDIDVHTNEPGPEAADRVNAFFSHLFDDEKRAAHYASLGRNGSIVTVHTFSAREAQEAADVLNNYGAIEVNADSEKVENARSQMVERIVEESKRLRGK